MSQGVASKFPCTMVFNKMWMLVQQHPRMVCMETCWAMVLGCTYGHNTLSPPKVVLTSIIFLQLVFSIMYGHHILDYFHLF
jgi:hypothetical protein